jgi:hypothetical protein
MKLSELIEAMQILLKYGDIDYPLIIRDREEIAINGIEPEILTAEDKARLEKLGWHCAIEGELCITDDPDGDVWDESYIYCFG